MELLKQRIIDDGRIEKGEVLKVDSFLNHQIDIGLLNKIGQEFKHRFENESITKILTIEASGISVACISAQYFNVPVVFAKKTESKNLDIEVYESEVYSYTRDKTYKIKVSKSYVGPQDTILIIDDFLANGNAVLGLKNIIDQAGAKLIGAGIVIEKGFQPGRKILEEKGIRVESLAIIKSMEPGNITFA